MTTEQELDNARRVIVLLQAQLQKKEIDDGRAREIIREEFDKLLIVPTLDSGLKIERTGMTWMVSQE